MMDREDLEWLEYVQKEAYQLYAMNRMPEDDFQDLDNVIDRILANNGVNTNEQDF